MQAKHNVIVAGAGPVGLTCALLLAENGIDVCVFEAADRIDSRMRASTFHPPTLDLLSDTGLTKSMIAAGRKVPVYQIRQHESAACVRLDLTHIQDATAHPFRLQLPQQDFAALVLDRLETLGVPVKFSTPIAAVNQRADAVNVTLDGATETSANWVIGADGAKSTVRRSLGLDYGGITHRHASVLLSTPFPFHEAIDGIDDVTYCWSKRGPFSLLRLKSLWRVSLYPGLDDIDKAADETRIREWLGYIHPDATDAEIGDINPYRVHERCVDRFRVGRVLLAGDAAHLNPPSGGMGMNGGIHDAVNLCAKLERVIKGDDHTLLDRYHRQRHFAVTEGIIPQASDNRARMQLTDPTLQMQRLNEIRRLTQNSEQYRAFLLKHSMISGLQASLDIE